MLPESEFPLDRVTWRDGQRLATRDMNDSVARETRLRWMHNRYIHGAAFKNWGIVDGFEVRLTIGGRSIGVCNGYAIDQLGRELVLSENVVADLPPRAGPVSLVLAIRYQGDKAYRSRRAGKNECTGSPLDPANERPIFKWLELDEVEPGTDVLLAGAHIAAGAAQGALVTSVRRYMHPMTRPRIGSGTTRAFQTEWFDIKLGGFSEEWVETFVDTSAVGFVHTPCYFAELSLPNKDAVILDPTGTILNPDSAGFTLRVFRAFLPDGFGPKGQDAKKQGWTVSWWGVEPEPEPVPGPKIWVSLGGIVLDPKILFL